MNAYVAAPGLSVDFAREVINSLSRLFDEDDFCITHDWTCAFEEHQEVVQNYFSLPASVRTGPTGDGKRKEVAAILHDVAVEDIQGVRDADVLVYLHTGKPTTCGLMELGMAMALNIPIVFYTHPDNAEEVFQKYAFLYHPDIVVTMCFSLMEVFGAVMRLCELHEKADSLLEEN